MSGWKLGLDGLDTFYGVRSGQEEPYFNEARIKTLRYEHTVL